MHYETKNQKVHRTKELDSHITESGFFCCILRISNICVPMVKVPPFNTSIETNTCMTLINYILFLEKSEPSADKAILSSLYTMFLV